MEGAEGIRICKESVRNQVELVPLACEDGIDFKTYEAEKEAIRLTCTALS